MRKNRDLEIAELGEHTYESFCDLIKAIEALGYDTKTAGRFAVFIGDTPCMDEAGNTLVIEDERIVARLKLDWDEDD